MGNSFSVPVSTNEVLRCSWSFNKDFQKNNLVATSFFKFYYSVPSYSLPHFTFFLWQFSGAYWHLTWYTVSLLFCTVAYRLVARQRPRNKRVWPLFCNMRIDDGIMQPVSKQRIGKHVLAAMTTNTTGSLLETVLFTRSEQTGYKEDNSVPRDSDPRKTALARASSIYKRQTHPLVREGAPQKQDRNCQPVINIWSW
jgi:hypothetical protein